MNALVEIYIVMWYS